ncbi:hypothetical protein BOTBODRAFT_169301 [Botryobasidium botryosum FD-172 SS1]|uniref:Uncharacterized protein n=1 Tax=Botryobasidium botryosum (strain FD-172 SS1) TaxID=930990 RepID=A0A067N9U1_BOTB1|nr:hypothetical protein BOTBODRAFT_169301 [Botryobasidium botryosum FD-172 SS1]
MSPIKTPAHPTSTVDDNPTSVHTASPSISGAHEDPSPDSPRPTSSTLVDAPPPAIPLFHVPAAPIWVRLDFDAIPGLREAYDCEVERLEALLPDNASPAQLDGMRAQAYGNTASALGFAVREREREREEEQARGVRREGR